jgi:hypothetical protein
VPVARCVHALKALREVLGKCWLEVEGETVLLRRGSLMTVDVAEFLSQVTLCRSHGHLENEFCVACVAPLTVAAP